MNPAATSPKKSSKKPFLPLNFLNLSKSPSDIDSVSSDSSSPMQSPHSSLAESVGRKPLLKGSYIIDDRKVSKHTFSIYRLARESLNSQRRYLSREEIEGIKQIVKTIDPDALNKTRGKNMTALQFFLEYLVPTIESIGDVMDVLREYKARNASFYVGCRGIVNLPICYLPSLIIQYALQNDRDDSRRKQLYSLFSPGDTHNDKVPFFFVQRFTELFFESAIHGISGGNVLQDRSVLSLFTKLIHEMSTNLSIDLGAESNAFQYFNNFVVQNIGAGVSGFQEIEMQKIFIQLLVNLKANPFKKDSDSPSSLFLNYLNKGVDSISVDTQKIGMTERDDDNELPIPILAYYNSRNLSIGGPELNASRNDYLVEIEECLKFMLHSNHADINIVSSELKCFLNKYYNDNLVLGWGLNVLVSALSPFARQSGMTTHSSAENITLSVIIFSFLEEIENDQKKEILVNSLRQENIDLLEPIQFRRLISCRFPRDFIPNLIQFYGRQDSQYFERLMICLDDQKIKLFFIQRWAYACSLLYDQNSAIFDVSEDSLKKYMTLYATLNEYRGRPAANSRLFDHFFDKLTKTTLPLTSLQIMVDLWIVLIEATSQQIPIDKSQGFYNKLTESLDLPDSVFYLEKLQKDVYIQYCPEGKLKMFFEQLVSLNEDVYLELMLDRYSQKLSGFDFDGETLLTKIFMARNLDYNSLTGCFSAIGKKLNRASLCELINKKNIEGNNALHIAIQKAGNDYNLVLRVLAVGSDETITSSSGQTPLYLITQRAVSRADLLSNNEFILLFGEILNQKRNPKTLDNRIQQLASALRTQPTAQSFDTHSAFLERLLNNLYAAVRRIETEIPGGNQKISDQIMKGFSFPLCKLLVICREPELLLKTMKYFDDQALIDREMAGNIKSEIRQVWGYDNLLLNELVYKEIFYRSSVIKFLLQNPLNLDLTQNLKVYVIILFLTLGSNYLDSILSNEQQNFFNLIVNISRDFSGRQEEFLKKVLELMTAKAHQITLADCMKLLEFMYSCPNRTHPDLVDIFKARVIEILQSASSEWLDGFKYLSDYVFHNLFSYLSTEKVISMFLEEEHNLQACFDTQQNAFQTILDDYSKILGLYDEFHVMNPAQLADCLFQQRGDNIVVFAILKELLSQTIHKVPHHIQMLCVLSMVNLSVDHRVFVQIGTGQGKSIILGMLAAYLAIVRDQYVDIVTANSYLMTRDALVLEPFYKVLGLSVATEIRHVQAGMIPKILYTIPTHLLNHYANQLLYRVKSLDLSLDVVNAFIPVTSNKALLVDELDILTSRSEQGCFVRSVYTIAADMHWIYYAIYELFRQSPDITEDDINHLITNHRSFQVIVNDPNLVSTVNLIVSRISYWFHGVKKFGTYEQGRDYDIVNREILFKNRDTGYLKYGSQEPNGVTQFLQIHHQFPISDELIASFAIDYDQYFLTYYQSMMGVTGSPGLPIELDDVKKTYRAKFFSLPHFRRLLGGEVMQTLHERPREIEAKVIDSEEAWARRVSERVNTVAVREKRPVLVVVESTRELIYLRGALANAYPNLVGNIQQLDGVTAVDHEHTEKIVNMAGQVVNDKGVVTFATFVGGRGIDIKISDKNILERSNGGPCGLHVILASYASYRLYVQIKGRTARQENKGSFDILFLLTTLAYTLYELGMQSDFSQQDTAQVVKAKLKNAQENDARNVIKKRHAQDEMNAIMHELTTKFFSEMDLHCDVYKQNNQLQTYMSKWVSFYNTKLVSPTLTAEHKRTCYVAEIGLAL